MLSATRVRPRQLAILALSVFCSSAQVPTVKPLSICDAIAQLPALNGKEIAVRGVWLSTGEGTWLAHRGESCSQNLITEGFVWSNSFYLVQAKDHIVDKPLSSEVRQRFKVAQDEPGRYSVMVTVVGTLETRVPPVVVHYPDGSLTGYGFGHLNTSPAELTYRRITDVELVQEKPPPRDP